MSLSPLDSKSAQASGWSRALVCTLLALSLASWLRAAEDAPAGDPKRDEQFFFDTFGTEQGLPQTNVVLAVLQTRDGYLWVGTEGGLAKFDGVHFESFRASNTPAFTNNLIHCLYEDRNGTLWIGTEEGLISYRDGAFTRAAVPDVPVRAIAEDREGRLWIGTYGHGVMALYAGQLESYEKETAMPGPFVLSLLVDSADRLWIGFEKANGVVVRENGVFRQYDPDGKIDGEIQTMCEQPHGTLWFGSRNHRLFQVKDGQVARFAQRQGVASSQIYDLRPARDGGLWIAASILQKIANPGQAAIMTASRVPNENIVAVYEDREGSIWLCAREGGLIRARQMPYRTITDKDGLPGNNMKTVSEDPSGNLWLAAASGVTKVAPDAAVTVYGKSEGLSTGSPWVVYAASDGSVWAGFRSSLSVWRGEKWQTIPAISGVYGIYEDRDHTMWLGTDSGIVRYKDGTVTPLAVELGQTITHASAFCEAPDGTLYIGIWDAGLLKVKNGIVTVINRHSGLPADDVRAVYVDRQGLLWIGLRSRGLAVYDQGQWLNPQALSEGLADHVSAITEDDRGQLWLGTPAGVMWAPKKELLAVARGERPMPKMHVAEMTDGIHTAAVWSGPQPVVWKTRDDRLLFATHRGVLAINPDHLPGNVVAPPVRIERAVIDRRAVPALGDIKIPAGTRELAIEYTALSFVQPDRVLFKYRLEGYEQDWVEAGTRRTAYYTNLPPGAYVFRVQACNSDGVWNETGATLAIVQQPHFYQTSWFVFAVLVTAAATILAAYRRHTAALRRENEKLNRLVAERTHELELSNTAKTEFLETVSHEIRNPLNGLNGLLGLLKRESLGVRARDLMDSVQACSQGLTRVFEEVLSHTRLEHGYIELQETSFSLRRLLQEVARSFAWQASQHGSRIQVELAPDFADDFFGDENKIKTIVGNFVGNAIKYAPGSPVELRAESHATAAGAFDVHLEVCDHGPGISPDEQKLIFRKFVRGADAKKNRVAGTGLGLATCRVLAQVLGGSVGVDSEAGHGAVFFLRVPLRRSAGPVATTPSALVAALIVEDERYNQAVLRGIALELGYAPEIASNAEQAEVLLAQKKFDIIFLDWELPGLKGGDIARRVRSRPGGEKPVIIAMTAHDSAEIRQQCQLAGMDEFLRKPYDAERVRRRISDVLARRNGHSVAPQPAAPADLIHTGLNLQAFASYARGAQEEASEAIPRYAEALDQELAALELALRADDAEQIARIAHRIHALAGIVGAVALMAAAKKMEVLPGAAAPTERQGLGQAIVAAAAALKTEICAIRTG